MYHRIKTPKSTYYYKKKKKKDAILQQFSQLYPCFSQSVDQTAHSKINEDSDYKEILNKTDVSNDEEKNSECETTDEDLSFDGKEQTIEVIDELEESSLINMCLLSLFYSGKFTQDAFRSVLKLFNLTTDSDIPTNFNSLMKILMKETGQNINYNKKWFCHNCKDHISLFQAKQRNCNNCKTRLSTFYYIPVEDQIRRLFTKKILPVKALDIKNTLLIEDIYDGDFYKKFKESVDSNNPNSMESNYSFILNTDGIELSRKSSISIWPFYLAINELPIEIRYDIDNIIIAGIMVSDGKPQDFSLFLEPIILDLKMLEFGLVVDSFVYKFFCIFGVFDKPARSMILNTTNSNGYFSCIKCYQKGLFIPFKKGSHHVYPYEKVDEQLRNNESYNIDLSKSQINLLCEKGIKGKTILSKLKFYYPIESSIIDSMHSIFLGSIKKLFVYWFEHSIKEPYSLKHCLEEINSRLKNIRPPYFINYAPRDISDFKLWHAHEFMSFILFFAIPVFYEIMPSQYFKHLLYLIISLEKLYSRQINSPLLKEVKIFLTNFVQDLESLYDIHLLNSGMHELLHLVDLTFNCGPINNYSCFPFEELNRKLTSLINGKDLIGDEFIKLWSVSQCLNIFLQNQHNSSKFVGFLSENFSLRSSNRKKNSKELKLGREHKVSLESLEPEIIELIKSNYKDKIYSIKFFQKLNFNSKIIQIDDCTRKFCNSFIKYKNSYALVKSIIGFENDVSFLCKKIYFIDNPFFIHGFNSFKSSFFIGAYSTDYFIIDDYENISVVLGCEYSKNSVFLTDFNGSHLFT